MESRIIVRRSFGVVLAGVLSFVYVGLCAFDGLCLPLYTTYYCNLLCDMALVFGGGWCEKGIEGDRWI